MSHVLEASYHHEREPSILRTPEDIDAFVDELLVAGWEYEAATVYAISEDSDTDPDHELVVGVRNASGLGSLRYAGADGEWFSRGEQTNPDGVEYSYFGTGHEFPADSEVPLSVVRQALRELLTSGGTQPTCLSWQAQSRP